MDLDKVKNIKISPNYILNGILIGIIIALGLFYFRDEIKAKIEDKGKVGESKSIKDFAPKTSKVFVDIDGAVTNPGLYEIEEGKRIYDVILLAGGFTKDVNTGEVSIKLNKAQKIRDGMKIFIPFNVQSSAEVNKTLPSSTNEPSIININDATKEVLEKLPKIGPSTADKIIQNRPYKETKELLTKKVIGESTFESIEDLISV